MEAKAPQKPKISDRTRHENDLLLWQSKISSFKSTIARQEASGDYRAAAENREMLDALTRYMNTSVLKETEFAKTGKPEKPIPAGYVPAHLTDAELTSHQRLIRNLDKHIEGWRQRADKFGIEGVYSEDVNMMHAVQGARDASIRAEKRISSKSPFTSAGDSGSWAWGLMAFAVLLPIFMVFFTV
jgi:hypothetical protein